MSITWNDGHKARYPVRYLRQHCPCAACTDEWTGELRLKPDDVPLVIMLQDISRLDGMRFRLPGVMGTIRGSIRIRFFAGYASAICVSR